MAKCALKLIIKIVQKNIETIFKYDTLQLCVFCSLNQLRVWLKAVAEAAAAIAALKKGKLLLICIKKRKKSGKKTCKKIVI